MDSWRKEDADKPRCEVKLYSLDCGEPGPEPFKSLVDLVGPRGWRWISVDFVRPGDDTVAEGAEEYAKALDELIVKARGLRAGLSDVTGFDDADDVPMSWELEDAQEKVERAYDDLVHSLDEAEA
jgi:hypothetical protein